ncbi:metallophosphoesterase [Oscillatoria sp. FACHB-1406]|uniref:metallophosphoesterase n=1 Tax=Oscillatoria sp. FACHB-1406 TaxID=2692846 RepID=UPI00168200CC|nr:metallophosphoesterase [Oscillatoria sp. FACHB-1406]MBD2580189.1 metallophosphoesterase [Oscillatoria sp. FACHB-1406]
MRPILREDLKVERFKIAIADLPPALTGLKLVQLSDFHYDGESLSDKLLARVIEAANRENPDLILLTGDYITDKTTPLRSLVRALKKLKSRSGVYACLGNHDVYKPQSKQKVTAALTEIGIKVLCNEIAYPFDEAFAIVGLADFWSGKFRPSTVFNQLDPAVPRIVLSHNPDTAEILQRWRVDLQLSGHTHGGQIGIPGLGLLPQLVVPWGRRNLPLAVRKKIPLFEKCSRVVQHWEWGQGLHRVGNLQLYVNRGLGCYFPGRFYCPPEVSAIELVPLNNDAVSANNVGSIKTSISEMK